MKYVSYRVDPAWSNVTCEVLNRAVEEAKHINPGFIKLNRKDFGRFILAIARPSFLPLSDKQYVLHLPTAYGVLPIFPSDNIPESEIRILPKVDVDEEFEKIVLS
jgi:hypothetical protein